MRGGMSGRVRRNISAEGIYIGGIYKGGPAAPLLLVFDPPTTDALSELLTLLLDSLRARGVLSTL